MQILTINENGSLILIDREAKVNRAIATINDLAIATKGEEFMCSSTIDFPEESTTNQEVINLCRRIRGCNG